jgi:O-antigen chain-terminating methyltransferase
VESAEIVAMLREVRERVRARNPQTAAGRTEVALPDLMPLVHARDAAMGKVAAIGSVNPRRGGPLNALVQGWKRAVARLLDWHVREQVEFNRRVIGSLDAVVETFNETNRALVEMGNRLAEIDDRLTARVSAVEEIARELTDIRTHWAEWRQEWERKLSVNEIQFLRSVADLQGGFQHRATLMDANYRDAIRAQHAEFSAALERTGNEIQRRLWADLERIRLEYERLIHSELRLVRQRAALHTPEAAPPAAAPSTVPDELPFDYARFAGKFRGPEEYVSGGQRIYVEYFRGCREVLDIGCGRGEFLELMRAAGVAARGVDLSAESVALCRQKGLAAETADLFAYLEALPEAALDGIFCSQVVEHLAPERLPMALKLCASRLSRGGVIAIETPNPECLAIFATHFYLDPTHTRPVPAALLAFYLEEFGLGGIEVAKLAPARDSMPSLGSLPADFREAFFGALDYAIIGRKL